jgi:hypothetical protein
VPPSCDPSALLAEPLQATAGSALCDAENRPASMSDVTVGQGFTTNKSS